MHRQKTALWLLSQSHKHSLQSKSKEAFSSHHKIELKKCIEGEIINTKKSTMSIYLLVVRLQYNLYVFGHLSI